MTTPLFSGTWGDTGVTFYGSRPDVVTWDPETAFEVTLSNGNLTATRAGGVGTPGTHVPFRFAKTSGKFYFEVTWSVMGGFLSGGNVGIFTTTATYSDLQAHVNNTASLSQGNFSDGGPIWAAGVHSPYNLGGLAFIGPYLVAGSVIAMAVDLVNRKMWFRVVTPAILGNLWNGNASADPATNVNGVVVPAGSIVPALAYVTNVDVLTGNFGASAFVGTVPAGFTSGWTP